MLNIFIYNAMFNAMVIFLSWTVLFPFKSKFNRLAVVH